MQSTRRGLMRFSLEKQKNITSFQLKQQFICLLSNELANSNFNIILGFESSSRERICTLKFADSQQIEIRINLGYIKKSVSAVGCSLMFKVCFCAFFVADYIKQVERAKNSIPKGYFDGLVILNAIEVCKVEQTVSVYSPLSQWGKKPKHTYCVRPIEVNSAINSINKIRLLAPTGLSKEDKAAIRTFGDNLLLYSSLPEVAYVHARIPVYTLVDSLKKMADLINSEPDIVQKFPILSLASFEQIDQLTVRDLFLSCVLSDNEFLTGIAVRLVAFFHLSYEKEFEKYGHEKLIMIMKQYIACSISYLNDVSASSGHLIKDNLFAIKTAVKAINDYLDIAGVGVLAGNIHSIM